MQILDSMQKFAANDGDVRFSKISWFQLQQGEWLGREDAREGNGFLLTKSRQDPPPKYSMMIHSLCPLRNEPLYWVT